jgi:hypothetical protein
MNKQKEGVGQIQAREYLSRKTEDLEGDSLTETKGVFLREAKRLNWKCKERVCNASLMHLGPTSKEQRVKILSRQHERYNLVS